MNAKALSDVARDLYPEHPAHGRLLAGPASLVGNGLVTGLDSEVTMG